MFRSYTPPTLDASAFQCPFCNVYAHQLCSALLSNFHGGTVIVKGFTLSQCSRCTNVAVWHEGDLIYPVTIAVTPPKPFAETPLPPVERGFIDSFAETPLPPPERGLAAAFKRFISDWFGSGEYDMVRKRKERERLTPRPSYTHHYGEPAKLTPLPPTPPWELTPSDQGGFGDPADHDHGGCRR